MVGDNDSGKTVLQNLIEHSIGKSNCSAVALQSLANDKFSVADLFEMMVNIYGDLNTTAIKETGTLKALIGNDPITGEAKFGGRFKFKNFAKLIFAMNKVPLIPEDELTFLASKMLFFVFKGTIPKDQQDPLLINKLTTPEELSGFFNMAMEGLIRLVQNNGFTDSKTINEVMKQYAGLKDPIKMFVDNCLVPGIGTETIQKWKLYEEFVNYCTVNKLQCPVKSKFFQKLYSVIPKNECRISIDGKQVEAIYGYILKPQEDIKTESNEPKQEIYELVNPDELYTKEEIELNDHFQKVDKEYYEMMKEMYKDENNIK